MHVIRIYTAQTVKWMALAGGYSVLLVGGLFAISWLLFEFLVLLVQHLP